MADNRIATTHRKVAIALLTAAAVSLVALPVPANLIGSVALGGIGTAVGLHKPAAGVAVVTIVVLLGALFLLTAGV